MKFIIRFLIKIATVIALCFILPKFNVGVGILDNDILTAVKVALVLTILNSFLKPILKIISLPITCLTLGLFSLVITAAMVKLTSYFVPGFLVTGTAGGWLTALIFGLAFSFITSVVEKFIVDED
jgi:putative membrane protein